MTIGVTGPSGAGKSLFCSMLAARGFCVLDCDMIYHEMIAAPGECTSELAMRFGEGILDTAGGIDRSALADAVFKDKAALGDLNRITHKYVADEVMARSAVAANAGIHVAIDAPLLFEAGLDGMCDLTVGILAPRGSRAARLIERDGASRTPEQLQARINASRDDSYYTERCSVTMMNNGDIDALGEFADRIAAYAEAK